MDHRGDFNSIRSKSERSNCVEIMYGAKAFNSFIEDCKVVDLPLTGYKFTWFGPSNKMSHLDRFLVDEQRFVLFNDLIQQGYGRLVSDHIPTKIRAVMWVRAVHNEYMFSEGDWWCWPRRCRLVSKSVRKGTRHWDQPPMGWLIFNVAGAVMEEVAGCGAVLRDDKGVVFAIFLGRCEVGGLEMAMLIAIKVAMEMVIERVGRSKSL